MSIHGLLQEPASYPSNFITLPFTIPPPPSYGSQIFKSSKRSVTSTGGVPTMTAGQDLQDTIFDFGDININLSRIVITIQVDPAVDYLGYAPFGMVCWEYGASSNLVIVTTYNAGLVNVTNWTVELIAFPLSGSTALLSYVNDTNQNARFSVANGTASAPQPTAIWTFNPPVGSSFNENQIVIGDTGILYIAEDSGKLLAVVDNGSSASLLWSVDTFFTGLIPPALGNGNLLYGVGTNAMKCVSNIDTATPALVWTANLTPLTAPLSPLVQYDVYGIPTIYVSGTGKVYSVSAGGVVNWVFSPVNNQTFLGVSLDGSVIYASAGNQLYALTTDGVQKWALTIGTGSGYPTIGDDGTIYVVSNNTFIYAVTDNGASATLKWTIDAMGGQLRKTLSINSNGSIYATSLTVIYSFSDNGASASLNWADNTLPVTPDQLTPITIGNDGLLYTTSDYGYFACITDNGASYTNNYGFQAVGSGFSSPCSIGTNNRVYYGGDHDFIIAI
jgi:hypothetical protein